jgi:hypothetical protein
MWEQYTASFATGLAALWYTDRTEMEYRHRESNFTSNLVEFLHTSRNPIDSSSTHSIEYTTKANDRQAASLFHSKPFQALPKSLIQVSDGFSSPLFHFFLSSPRSAISNLECVGKGDVGISGKLVGLLSPHCLPSEFASELLFDISEGIHYRSGLEGSVRELTTRMIEEHDPSNSSGKEWRYEEETTWHSLFARCAGTKSN